MQFYGVHPGFSRMYVTLGVFSNVSHQVIKSFTYTHGICAHLGKIQEICHASRQVVKSKDHKGFWTGPKSCVLVLPCSNPSYCAHHPWRLAICFPCITAVCVQSSSSQQRSAFCESERHKQHTFNTNSLFHRGLNRLLPYCPWSSVSSKAMDRVPHNPACCWEADLARLVLPSCIFWSQMQNITDMSSSVHYL